MPTTTGALQMTYPRWKVGETKLTNGLLTGRLDKRTDQKPPNFTNNRRIETDQRQMTNLANRVVFI